MKKILVIEDQEEVRENICEILELSGYEVQSAENGKRGCEQAVHWLPDLILCDVMMPELDGFGLLKILQNRPETQMIPLIFLTAKVEPEDMRKGMGLGADDYLTKPFDDTQLLEAVEIRLKKREVELQKSLSYKSEISNLHSSKRQEEKLSELVECGEGLKCKDGSELWREGQYAKGLFYIRSGNVKLYRRHANGKIFIVDFCGPGNFIGISSLLAKQVYQTTAEVGDSAEIIFIPEDIATQKIFDERDIAVYFMITAWEKANSLEDRALDYAYSSVRRRVAMALLQQKKQQNSTTVEISRDDLAAFAGTAKETTIRTLSDFKNEGVIELAGRAIKILSLESLLDERL